MCLSEVLGTNRILLFNLQFPVGLSGKKKCKPTDWLAKNLRCPWTYPTEEWCATNGKLQTEFFAFEHCIALLTNGLSESNLKPWQQKYEPILGKIVNTWSEVEFIEECNFPASTMAFPVAISSFSV